MADAATLDLKALSQAVGEVNKQLTEFRKGLIDLNDSGKTRGSDSGEGSARSGFEQLGSGLKTLGTRFQDISKRATKVAEAFGEVKSSVLAVHGLLRAQAAPGAEVASSAAQIGVTPQDLQALRFAGRSRGVSQQQVDQGLENLVQILRTDREKQDKLAVVGVDTGASLREVILQLGDVFKTLEGDPAAQAILAGELLGDTALLPLLNTGGEAIDGDLQRAERLGVVANDGLLAAQQDLDKALTEVEGAMIGIGNAVRANLLPLVVPLVESLSELLQLEGVIPTIGMLVTGLVALGAVLKGGKLAVLIFGIAKSLWTFVRTLGLGGILLGKGGKSKATPKMSGRSTSPASTSKPGFFEKLFSGTGKAVSKAVDKVPPGVAKAAGQAARVGVRLASALRLLTAFTPVGLAANVALIGAELLITNRDKLADLLPGEKDADGGGTDQSRAPSASPNGPEADPSAQSDRTLPSGRLQELKEDDVSQLPSLLGSSSGGPGQLGWIRQIVEFRNAPPGTRVSNDSSQNIQIESEIGISMVEAST